MRPNLTAWFKVLRLLLSRRALYHTWYIRRRMMDAKQRYIVHTCDNRYLQNILFSVVADSPCRVCVPHISTSMCYTSTTRHARYNFSLFFPPNLHASPKTLNVAHNRNKDIGVKAMSCAALGQTHNDHSTRQRYGWRQQYHQSNFPRNVTVAPTDSSKTLWKHQLE